ncbi:MAG TPA: type II toxin-antitoxin system VapC family toxin [Caulobacteraceae bacterium]|jgi:PIN domain nuclease of toxin-antitoxin system|nr:type II toxin-antitoxin system VapC family toxin [Caulobacteraceae bacterium]
MQLLLDTHVFLWWEAKSPDLGARAKALIGDPSNLVFVSAAAIWEIGIKRRLKKLQFLGSATDTIVSNGFTELPIGAEDAEFASDLDWNHADPFDRLMAAQAIRRSLTIVSVDRTILDFGEVASVSAR